MKIHLTLSAREIREESLTGKVAVVIDVLRATSVVITALSNGAAWVKTVASVDEARALKSTDNLLGGERNALPIEGFDCGNSPLEYASERVAGKGIILSTTNGTLAVSRCRHANTVVAAACINQQSVSDFLMQLDQPVELICAGTNGEFSLDDFLCAGLIGHTLQQAGKAELDDLGRLAVSSWVQASGNLHGTLSECHHYQVLQSKGFQRDLEYCLTPGTHTTLPILRGDRFYPIR